jgi:N utilization substance protein B
MKGARHKARELALQVLYEIDSVGHKPDQTLERILSKIETSADASDFVTGLVKGVIENREQLDQNIRD